MVGKTSPTGAIPFAHFQIAFNVRRISSFLNFAWLFFQLQQKTRTVLFLSQGRQRLWLALVKRNFLMVFWAGNSFFFFLSLSLPSRSSSLVGQSSFP